MKGIIVDDDKNFRQKLITFCEELPQAQVLRTFDSKFKAASFLQKK